MGWKDKVTARTAEVPLCLDGAVGAALAKARRTVERLEADDDSLAAPEGLAEARAELEELEARAAAATYTFEVKGLPWRQWRELVDAHPATEGTPTIPMARGMTVQATLVPPAIVACCDDFDSEDDLDVFAEGQLVQLFLAVTEVNGAKDSVPPT